MKNRILICVLIAFLCSPSIIGQTTVIIDSLYQVLKATHNDTVKAKSHYELGWYLKLQDLNGAIAHMDSSITIYKELELPGEIALSNFQFSVLYRLSGDYDKALESLTKFQDYVESVKDTANFTYAFYEKGVVYSQKGDLEKALGNFIEANKLSRATRNADMVASTLNSIGIVYIDLKKYDQAITSLKEAESTYKNLGRKDEHLGDVYFQLANAYKNKNELKKCRSYYERALANYQNADSDFGVALVNFQFGLLLNEEGQFRKAIPFFEKAYEIQKRNDYSTELLQTLSNLATAHSELGNLKKSETYLKEGVALNSNSKQHVKELNLELYRLFEKRKKYKEALEYHKVFVVYKDSILNEANIKNINELDKKYQTEKKDKEIATQQLALREQETEIQAKKSQNNFMLGGLVFLIVGTTLLIFLFKQRQKRKNQELLTLKREFQIKTLESLIEGEEKERLRVAKELHDGVNGDLAAIKYKLSSLLEMNNTVIKEAIAMIDDSCKQVRAISHNLIPPSLENFNLLEATQVYCANLNDVSPSIEINFQHLGEDIDIPKKAEVNAFRIIQELVTNAVRHSEASHINVQISAHENIIQITVEDDGKGFDKHTIESDGIGLGNVQSRTDYLNATTDFISNDKGTSYTIDINKELLNGD
ncbi:tetratricopeptide repeat-containing sensor histidine kinase [Flagellimonas nanhaiensis]|uniref:histidine kinase n=1 Tax=Flagellimonas nanhaiensis TaxID=2292706 RepID=A0A371JSQ9_9FLAO|nr:tetratricopeptide repeat protein [Allomuricauda nanhaiensis]RDY60789.1 hypothetical protein DX873_00995 [Allomuricauda nanhaiensis]